MSPTSPLRAHLVSSVEHLEQLLARLPGPVGREVKDRIAELRGLLAEQRPPRFAIVGRRGSGKSSLVNALFGAQVAELGHERAQTAKGEWHSYDGERGSIDVLDTRGLQEGAPPEAADAAISPLESIMRELRAKPPDAVLFLIKASDVDSGVAEDLHQLSELSKALEAAFRLKTPIVVVITHCDEVEPKTTRLHAAESEPADDVREKLARIGRIERIFEDRLRGVGTLRDQLVAVLGICAYQSFRNDGTRRADERWRIDELVSFLFAELPDQARVELARVAQVQRLQLDIANRLTVLVAGICAGVAATPIPIADLLPLTGLQVSLVTAIGHVAGRVVTAKTAGEFLVAMGLNVGAGFALREVARAIVKFAFPGGGLYVSAAVAYAGTVGLGRAAAGYFIRGLPADAAKAAFDDAYLRAGGEAKASETRSPLESESESESETPR